jgi:choline monooxygenase
MERSLSDAVNGYNRQASLERASTIPADWYTSSHIRDLERRTVFRRAWQLAGRADQVRTPGQYLSCVLASGEPVVVVRGTDGLLRGFFNVCRHHAAAVVTDPEGSAQNLRCPYHGWTYSLSGELKGTPDFDGVCDFDRAANGLVPLEVGLWEKWIFVKQDPAGPSLDAFLGPDVLNGVRNLGLGEFFWFERRHYTLDCNWKVFVDNYLDGGYHVPHLHKALDNILEYSHYTVELGEHSCLQSSPIVSQATDAHTRAARGGDRAYYYWIYPNFMINWYDGSMDTNLVIPHEVDKTEVIFDFYFPDISDAARAHNRASIQVSEQIQDEDVSICTSVQRGLNSSAYTTGRLSVRREAGERLFHGLLYDDLRAGLTPR